MSDFLFVLLTVAFFAVTTLLVGLLDRRVTK